MRVRHRVAPGFLAVVPAVHRRRRWLRRYVAILVAIDGLAAAIGAVSAYLVRFTEGATGYVVLSMALPVLWVVALGLAGAYETPVLGLGSEEFQRVTRAFVALTAAVGFFSYATKAEVARGYVVLALPLALAFCLLARYGARKRLHALRRRGSCLHDVVAVGGEHSIVDLVVQLRHEPYSGMRVVGACLAAGTGHLLELHGVPVFGGLDDVASSVRRCGADTVAVTSCAEIDPARLRRLAWEMEGTQTDLLVAPGLIEVAGPRLHIRPVTGFPLLHVEEPEFSGARRLIKAAVDRAVAAVGLLLFGPLLLVLAAGVRLTSPGPAIFRQIRIGKDGREFTMLKLRTMVIDAELRRTDLATRNERGDGPLFKIRQDPRVTGFGRLLRKLSLDELPQLINILSGSMSLVGPRPPLPEEVALYEADARRRLLVKPGLTGLWQVSGRSDLTWEESVRLDLRYVENWSLTLDLLILWKTVSAISGTHGAY
ncbi:MAG TPA: sugar transferase [Mycobacteriales bacterium]|nr:sugar transferase [Mycobacteriales bacterium]